ncbi:DUF3100 domain-containing protein [Nocardia sp. NPDC004123]
MTEGTRTTNSAGGGADDSDVSENKGRLTFNNRRLWVLISLAVVIASVAQLIGVRQIPLAKAEITLLPLVWALLAGAAVSAQQRKPLPVELQHAASGVMALGSLILVARLGFSLGPNITVLADAGPALLLQELGHLFGTILIALPLAVLLKMGAETVGATFSIDREPAFAMVSERFGSGSPQYRGVLAMYAFGAVFGALIISAIASLAASFGIFDPQALAMGAGVGSTSMMIAAVASINSAFPGLAEETTALATASNLITAMVGVYIGAWIALPLADRLYRRLTRRAASRNVATEPSVHTQAAEPIESNITVPLWTSIPTVVGVGVIVSSIETRSLSWDRLFCYALMAAVTLVGLAVSRLSRGRIPAIISVVTIAAVLAMPFSPVATWILEVSQSVSLGSAVTMILTFAGLSIGKDLPVLRNIGWKIIPVGTAAIAASYLVATVLAELTLGLWHS